MFGCHSLELEVLLFYPIFLVYVNGSNLVFTITRPVLSSQLKTEYGGIPDAIIS
jgi:hypothetical protein